MNTVKISWTADVDSDIQCPMRFGTIQRFSSLLVAGVTVWFSSACAVDESPAPEPAQLADVEPSGQATQSLASDATSPTAELYYITTRPDFRKCISPVCGGHFVKAVNLKKTKCFDGMNAEDCYVTGYDFSALGLSASEEEKLTYLANSGGVVMRGHYEQYSPYFPVAELVVSEAWAGVSGDAPSGSFYGVTNNGIVCVTYPCLSYDEVLLNVNTVTPIAGVDLSYTSATAQQIQGAIVELNATGLVIAGENFKVSGPAGTAPALRASEFYRQP